MADDDASIGAARDDTLLRLAESRAEIRRLLEPPPRTRNAEPGVSGDGAADRGADVFPRSRTMKLLMSGKGLGTVAAVVGSVLIARPALGWRLLRMVPIGALSRMLLVKGIASLSARRD